MKYCILGAGLMGKAILYDLLRDFNIENIIVVDSDENKLNTLRDWLPRPYVDEQRLITKKIDINNLSEVENIFKECDGAIGAIHYKFNETLTKIAIKTKTHFCDLGGNNTVVDAQLKLNEEAKKNSVSIIPDCGLAPGMVSIFVKWGIEKLNWVDTVKIRVGGLPQNPKNELKYEKLFSVDGLINEYIEPVRVLQNGEIKVVEPLTEVEEVKFKGHEPFEAFTTSGGVSTLIDTYKSELKNLDYKTIRYSGHCKKLKELQKNNLFTKEYFEKNLPLCTEDMTLVKIIFEGNSQKHEIEIIDKAKPPFTSMMRMTGFPISIISSMQVKGQITEYGVMPQEKCVQPDIFIEELQKRKIQISGLNLNPISKAIDLAF